MKQIKFLSQWRRLAIVLCMASVSTLTLFAQGISVSGTVTDAAGSPLPGATVLVRGTTQGTITDAHGKYTITVPNEDAVLVFSFVGYSTEEIIVGQKVDIKVSLQEGQQIEEVVVVAYGTQKKANLTGAVDQVGSEVFEKRPITNATQALVGAIPNLNIQLADGKPTQSPAYNIRGTTSIGQQGSALVLIDGVEGDPRMLNPNDIESVSVLKDAASASIYGARAAFGVVLITTKSATKGRTSITYTANLSSKSPTAVPDYYNDSYPWAKNFSDAWSNWQDNGRTPTAINKTQAFSPDYLAEIKRRYEDPSLPRYEIMPNKEYRYYYSTDWYKELYKDSFFAQDHNISVSGGNDIASFYVTGRYNGQDGLYRYNTDKYAMYNLRAKGNVQLTKWLKIENNTEYSNMKYHQPYNTGEGSNIWRNIADEGHPLAPLTNPDGTLSFSSAYTVGDMYLGKSFGEFQQRLLKNKVSAVATFFDNMLSLRADYAFQNTDYGHQIIRVQVPYSRYQGTIGYAGADTNDFETRKSQTTYQAANFYADFTKSFNQAHNLHVLAGYNYEQSVYNNLTLVRNGIVFDEVQDQNLTVGDKITPSGGYTKWRIAGGFFRLNYNFKERYLMEFNGRYDGSSKFPEGQQWAFFPSGSLGWRISQEGFWDVSPKVISNLKLRVSYGSLGNGTIGAYNFIDKFGLSQSGRILNGARPQRTAQPAVVPNTLTWETSTTGDIGLDVTALNSRLVFTGDVYRRWTSDMYTKGPSLPAVYGTDVPKGNYADLETTGWEISVEWNDMFNVADKPFRYNVKFTLSDYIAEITKYFNPDKDLSDYYVGQRIGEIWGYYVDGLFRSNEEAAAAPNQGNLRSHTTQKQYKGDLKFRNLDNDQIIWQDLNRVGQSGDKRIIGNRSPRYQYSISLGADWNGFFFSSFFQGVMKQDWYPSSESGFWGQYNRPYNLYPRWQVGKIYTDELENFDALLPKISGYMAQNGNGALNKPNDRFLQDVSYIRLRNITIGYTIPTKISEKIGAANLQVYLSGENIWSWSPLYKLTRDYDVANIYGSGSGRSGFDSASAGGTNLLGTGNDGYNYPTLKTFSFGLTVTF